MKFGSKFGEAGRASSPGSGGGKWLKTLKEGETRMRFLQEIDEWVVYYEHYNPSGTSFPCTSNRDTCPGCTSNNERMKSASRKVAVNAVVGQYQDVYKLPITLVNRLKIKSERNGNTITDRDYIITRIGMDKDTEYDVESGNALPIDTSAYELFNIEQMLQTQFEENWPDFEMNQVLKAAAESPTVHKTREKKGGVMGIIAERAVTAKPDEKFPEQRAEPKSPPSEPAAQSNEGEQEVELTLDQLHAMTPEQLRTLCANNGAPVPDELGTQQEIISWMEQQFA